MVAIKRQKQKKTNQAHRPIRTEILLKVELNVKESFEDTKSVIRSRNSTKDRQCNGQRHTTEIQTMEDNGQGHTTEIQTMEDNTLTQNS